MYEQELAASSEAFLAFGPCWCLEGRGAEATDVSQRRRLIEESLSCWIRMTEDADFAGFVLPRRPERQALARPGGTPSTATDPSLVKLNQPARDIVRAAGSRRWPQTAPKPRSRPNASGRPSNKLALPGPPRETARNQPRPLSLFLCSSGPRRPSHGSTSSSLFAAWAAVGNPPISDQRSGGGVCAAVSLLASGRLDRAGRKGGALWFRFRNQADCRRWKSHRRLGGKQTAARRTDN